MLSKKIIVPIFQIGLILIACLLILIYLLTNVIDWYYPDSIVQIGFVKETNLLGAIYANWAYTTLGRPGGVFWIDLWFYFADLFNFNNFYGLILYRISSFAVAGLGILMLVKELFKINFLLSLYISLLFILIFIISTGQFNLTFIWELDLSLYVVGIFYFCILVIYGLKINKGEITKFNFIFFTFFYLLYLNSSYAHLVTGGLLLLILFFDFDEFKKYLLSPKKICYDIFLLKENRIFFLKRNKIFLFQLFVYLLSAIINLLSPSIGIRENIWPSDSSFITGLITSLPLLEYSILHIWGFKYLYITFTIIFLIKFLDLKINISNFVIISLILLTPFILILTNALAYLSESLHTRYSPDSGSIYIFKNLFYLNHASSARHMTYYNLHAIVSYIFLGVMISKINYSKKKVKT